MNTLTPTHEVVAANDTALHKMFADDHALLSLENKLAYAELIDEQRAAHRQLGRVAILEAAIRPSPVSGTGDVYTDSGYQQAVDDNWQQTR